VRTLLDQVWAAGNVRERGPVAGDGWSGVRYAFTMTPEEIKARGKAAARR
jgi:hypothetical protein